MVTSKLISFFASAFRLSSTANAKTSKSFNNSSVPPEDQEISNKEAFPLLDSHVEICCSREFDTCQQCFIHIIVRTRISIYGANNVSCVWSLSRG